MTEASARFNNDLRYRPADHDAQTQLTPSYVLDPVREVFGGSIDVDPCTTPENPVGATIFYTVDVDGLAHEWGTGSVFVNPPYGKAREPWVEKCIEAAGRGARVILLMPAATDTRIFQRAVSCADDVLYVKGRLKFGVLRPNRRQVAASHPSALIGWNVDLTPCAHLGLRMRPANPTDPERDGGAHG